MISSDLMSDMQMDLKFNRKDHRDRKEKSGLVFFAISVNSAIFAQHFCEAL